MSDVGKAVFLSYASQDAEPARRICEALRANGVEVWFDTDGGLEHGDEWDAKIRRQIKECVLFIPIISANTQAREEGYFRIEWDLAAERARGIAGGVAFILPVVIDDTREPDALVPDRFRTVQWTKLPGGVVPPEVNARLLRLWSHRVGAVKHEAAGGRGRPAPAGEPAPVRPVSPRPRGRLGLIIGAAAAVALFGALGQKFLQREKHPPPSPAPPPREATSATDARTFPRDPELKRAWEIVLGVGNATSEDFALAEDLVKAELAQRPMDPETVIVYAWVHNAWLNRGFDVSEERHVLGRRFAERAVQLAPDDPEAIAAHGFFLSFRGADFRRAEQLLRRAIELNPGEARFHRALAYNVLRFVRPAEGLALAERTAERFPSDALAQYELGLNYRDAGRHAEMERAFDRTLALAPLAGAIIWKAWFACWLHADLAASKRWLEQLPASARLMDRTLVMRQQYALLSREPAELAEVLQSLQAFPGATFRDFYYSGPKALLIADVLAAQGKPELARMQYERALAEITRDRATNPTDINLLQAELWTLIGLGRREAAVATARLAIGSQPQVRQTLNTIVAWWFNVVPACLLLGERELALQELRKLAISPGNRTQLRMAFRTDVRMASVRDDPAIVALINEPAGGTEQAATDPKSVAVLAFKNLSGDPAREFFSEGLSEAVADVLGRVPGLKVTASASAFSFKGRNVPVPEIARQLGVSHLVDGTVWQEGQTVRITAKLIKADGFQVWVSDRLERELKNIFALHDEVAGLIAKQLSLTLGVASPDARREVNPEAYQLYLSGRRLWNRRLEDDYVRAEALFSQAIDLDPKFARAWAGRADARLFLASRRGQTGTWARRSAPQLDDAEADLRQALRLDPDLAEARASLGSIFTHRAAPESARREYLRAIELNPNYASAHQWLGLSYWRGAMMPEARAAVLRAVEVDPLSSVVAAACSIVLHDFGDHHAALRHADRAVALQPDSPRAISARASALYAVGQRDAAVALARSLIGKDATHQGLGRMLLVLGRAGLAADVEQARQVSGPLAEVVRLQGAAALGRWDEFFAGWNSAAMSVDNMWYLFDPALDPVRADPRFLAALKEADFLEAHERAQAWRAAHPPQVLEARK